MNNKKTLTVTPNLVEPLVLCGIHFFYYWHHALSEGGEVMFWVILRLAKSLPIITTVAAANVPLGFRVLGTVQHQSEHPKYPFQLSTRCSLLVRHEMIFSINSHHSLPRGVPLAQCIMSLMSLIFVFIYSQNIIIISHVLWLGL